MNPYVSQSFLKLTQILAALELDNDTLITRDISFSLLECQYYEHFGPTTFFFLQNYFTAIFVQKNIDVYSAPFKKVLWAFFFFLMICFLQIVVCATFKCFSYGSRGQKSKQIKKWAARLNTNMPKSLCFSLKSQANIYFSIFVCLKCVIFHSCMLLPLLWLNVFNPLGGMWINKMQLAVLCEIYVMLASSN